jgi:tetratricopeptide (TPR) repeat protein
MGSTFLGMIMKDKINKLLEPIMEIWDKQSPKLKKILKLYFIISNALLLIAIILAILFSPSSSTEDESNVVEDNEIVLVKSDSLTKLDSLRRESSAISTHDTNSSNQQIAQNNLKSINGDAHDSLGRIYFKQKRFREALFHFEQIKVNKKDHPDFMKIYAQTLFHAANYKEFLTLFKASSTQDSAMIFRARFNLGDELSVIKTLENLSSKSHEFKILRAEFHLAMGKVSLAKGILDRLLRANDFDIKALFLASRIQRLRSNPKACHQLLKRLLRYQPLHSEAYALKGLCLLDLELTKDSEHSFKTALELNPGDYNTWHNLGILHYSLSNSSIHKDTVKKHLRLAASSFEKALKLESNHPSPHYHLALILSFNKQYHEAIRHFNKIPKGDLYELNSWVQKGANWESLDELDSSYQSYHQAFLLAPLNTLIQKELLRIEGKINF